MRKKLSMLWVGFIFRNLPVRARVNIRTLARSHHGRSIAGGSTAAGRKKGHGDDSRWREQGVHVTASSSAASRLLCVFVGVSKGWRIFFFSHSANSNGGAVRIFSLWTSASTILCVPLFCGSASQRLLLPLIFDRRHTIMISHSAIDLSTVPASRKKVSYSILSFLSYRRKSLAAHNELRNRERGSRCEIENLHLPGCVWRDHACSDHRLSTRTHKKGRLRGRDLARLQTRTMTKDSSRSSSSSSNNRTVGKLLLKIRVSSDNLEVKMAAHSDVRCIGKATLHQFA